MDDQYLMRAEGVLGDAHSFVRLVDTMPLLRSGLPPSAIRPGDQRIVDAARVSIAGNDVDAKNPPERLIRYLVKNRHTSPLEQVRFTFHVRLPMFCARQWIRHRTGSFNEESARYGKLRDDFYIPPMSRMNVQAEKNKQASGDTLVTDAEAMRTDIDLHCRDSYKLYENLLEGGLARELARMVLPVNVYTQWFWTTDLHNLMHFLTLRTHGHAQSEMRDYAEAMIPMARAVAPIAMDAWLEYRETWAKAMKL